MELKREFEMGIGVRSDTATLDLVARCKRLAGVE